MIYFASFLNKSFHDLTTPGTIPFSAASILGNGFKFVITPKKSIKMNEIRTCVERFSRIIDLKVHFSDGEQDNHTIERLRVNSDWIPDDIPLEIQQRVSTFTAEVSHLLRPRTGKSNITVYQASVLDSIRKNGNVIIAQADKNLGPVALDTKSYIRMALDEHLLDTDTYVQVSEEDARQAICDLHKDIIVWTRKYSFTNVLSLDHRQYIQHHVRKNFKDPLGYLYLLVKLHKTPMSTRPVVSDCGSLPFPLGEWLNQTLLPYVIEQPSYIKDSFTLKRELNDLALPPNASLVTFDATSMYTNINIHDCIDRIEKYLREISAVPRDRDVDAIISAMKLVMLNNRFRFGDLIFHQIRGIAMGMSPAPTIANLYVAIYELSKVLPLIDDYLYFYRRFIDDGLCIWLHDADPIQDAKNWKEFQSIINDSGLQWTFVKPSKQVVFLDMTIEIENGKIVTSLYAKPLALYQYIPPSSCHPPGVLTGLVLGQVLRIFQLSSRDQDINNELRLFYKRLIDRGYNREGLLPLFARGIDNAKSYMALSQVQREARKEAKVGKTDEHVCFHIPFHPQNPPSKRIQRLWRETILSPIGEKIFTDLRNANGFPVPVKRLIVAYSRNPNIANLTSYRILSKRTGLKASSFIGTHS